MSNVIRILIADDHPIVRHGLRQLIELDPALRIVAEAEDGLQALAAMESHRPEVAILDIDMQGMDGFAVARELRARKSAAAIVFLTMHKDEEMFNEALNLGARGYVLKESTVTDIVACIKAAAAGQHFISPALSTFLLHRTARAQKLREDKPRFATLTPTERRILRLLSENRTSREIADLLFVSVRTIENHRANICTKLDLRGSNALLKFAIEHKSELGE